MTRSPNEDKAPSASVVVLNWNGAAYLEECLAAVAAQTRRDFELIVVDNLSTDGSREWLVERGRDFGAIVVLNDANIGYAAGNNRGMARARGKWIALLNNDATVDRKWLEKLIEAAASDDAGQNVGMAASKTFLYDRRDVLDNTGHLAYPDGLNRGRGRLEKDSGQYDDTREALFPSGCAGLYLRKMMEEIGGFDERFFAYGDDADVGLRGRIAGYRCVFAPEAKVYHRYSASTSAYSSFKAYHVERNRIWVLLKNYPMKFILASPFYTLARYALQAYGALTGVGAAGGFVKGEGAVSLIKVLFRAIFDAIKMAPAMLAERKKIWGSARINQAELAALLDANRISVGSISLAD